MTPRELIDAFEVVAEAPDGVKRLRELVLQLAVRGKLVAQVEGDEPAGVLLARIAAARGAVAKSGKVRKAEALAPVRAEEVPFEVPHSWCWARFASVAAIASNLVKPSDYPDEPHVAPDNIEKGTGRLMATRTVRQDGVTSANHRFFAGQVLYSKIRPNLSKAAVVDFDGLCSADMYPIDAAIERGYLLRFILSLPFVEQVTSDDNRLAMPKVNQEQLSVVLVSVPPLKEQHRIVARVDELMGLLDRLEAARKDRDATHDAARDSALAALRDADTPDEVEVAWNRIAERMPELFTRPADLEPLRQAVLQLAVRGRLVRQDPNDEQASVLLERIAAEKARLVKAGKLGGQKPVELDRNWERPFRQPAEWWWTRMVDVADVVGGMAKGRKLEGTETVEVPYLRVANVQAGHLDLSVVKTIEVPTRELEGYSLKSGDVLLTEGGDWDKLGRSAVWSGEIPLCVHQNHVFRARPLAPDLLPRWVSMFTNSLDGRAYFQSCSKQTTNLASINMTQLRACPLPIPPAAEQHRIVAKVDALMAIIDQLEARLTAATDLHAQFAAAAVHHLDA